MYCRLPMRKECWGKPSSAEYTLRDLLRWPNVSYAALMSLPGAGEAAADRVRHRASR